MLRMDPRLVEAALKGNVNELNRLLEVDYHLLDRSSVAVYPETALHIAAMRGQAKFVRELLKLKPDLATRLDKGGFGAIHLASANGFVETVRELLTFSRELASLRSSDGRTSLHCAVVTGKVQVLKELLGFRPDSIREVTLKSETAFHLAVKYNQFDVFKAMVDLSKKMRNIKDILNAGDEDGNTVLHLAIARKQSQVVKLLLGGDGSQLKELDLVNLTNKSGFTALDVSDVIHQMVGEPTDFMLRDLLLRAKALRASEVQHVEPAQIFLHGQISVTQLPPETSTPPTLGQFLLSHIKLLNPLTFLKKLAEEVKDSPAQTQNALLVVAVLIATMTYQAMLSPPAGVSSKDNDDQDYSDRGVFSSKDNYDHDYYEKFIDFLPFMVPNSIGFFVSLTVIILAMDEFPLKALLGIAVRCMGASYLCGLLLIGPPTSYTGKHASTLAKIIIAIIVLIDLLRLTYWLAKRWFKESRPSLRSSYSWLFERCKESRPSSVHS